MSSMFGFHDDYIVVVKKTFHYSNVFFSNHLCQPKYFYKKWYKYADSPFGYSNSCFESHDFDCIFQKCNSPAVVCLL